MAFGDKNTTKKTITRNIVAADVRIVKPVALEEFNAEERKELREMVKNNNETDLSGLLPDPEALSKARVKPMALEMAQEKGRAQALKVMNTIRTLGPAINRAFQFSDKDEEQAEYFVKVMAASSNMAKKTASKMGVSGSIENNRWMLNVLERIFIESLTDEMISKGDIGEKMAEEIFAVALEREQEKSQMQFQDMPMKTSIQLAIMKGMTPVLAQQDEFDFYRDRDNDLHILTQILMNRAAAAVNEVLDPVSKEEDRVITFKVMVEEGGKILAQCWQKYAKKVKEALSEKTENEVKVLLSQRPEGFNIKELIDNFENQFRRLKDLTKIPK